MSVSDVFTMSVFSTVRSFYEVFTQQFHVCNIFCCKVRNILQKFLTWSVSDCILMLQALFAILIWNKIYKWWEQQVKSLKRNQIQNHKTRPLNMVHVSLLQCYGHILHYITGWIVNRFYDTTQKNTVRCL